MPEIPREQVTGLVWEGAAIDEIARDLATPCFLVSEAALLRNYTTLRDALGTAGVPVVIRYCAKANNELGVMRILATAGSHVLTSYNGELELARMAGFPPERTAYQQPVLDGSELSNVLTHDLDLVHLYRESDIEPLETAARAQGRRVAVSIRLRKPAIVPTPIALLSERLGVDEDDAIRIARRIDRSESLSLLGLNFYIGTQQNSPGSYRSMLRCAGRILRALMRDGIAISEVNIGGGIPSPSLNRPGLLGLAGRWADSSREEAPNALADICHGLATQFAENVLDGIRGERPRLAAEPGRAIAGNAVIFLTRVTAIQGDWIFLDGSRNSLGESPLLFHRRILPVRPSAGELRYWNLSGNTVNTLDVIDFHRQLPTPRKGDLIAFHDAGAYSISRAARYAGLSPAVHLLGSNGVITCIRQAESIADLASRMAPGP